VTPPGGDSQGAVETPQGIIRCTFAESARKLNEVIVSIRPESIILSGANGANGHAGQDERISALRGSVAERLFVGEMIDYVVNSGGAELRVRSNPHQMLALGDTVELRVRSEHCLALPA